MQDEQQNQEQNQEQNSNKKTKFIAIGIYVFIATVVLAICFISFKVVSMTFKKEIPIETTTDKPKTKQKEEITEKDTKKKPTKKSDGELFTKIETESKAEEETDIRLDGLKGLQQSDGVSEKAEVEVKDDENKENKENRKLIGMNDLSGGDVEILNKTVKKSFASIGDEITYQDNKLFKGTEDIAVGYQTHLAKYYNLSNFRNFGIEDATVVQTKSGGNSLLTKYTDVKMGNIDYLFLMAGSNDYRYGVPLGNVEDINTGNLDTFYGAYSKLVDELKRNSEGKLQLWTPTIQQEKVANDKGYFLDDYVNAIRNIGRAKDVSVCNLNKSNQFSHNNLDILTIDGVHPNNAGYEVLSVDIINCINPILE